MYRIVTDTSANLPWSYVEENDLTVVPFSYRIDGNEYFETSGSFDGPAYYNAIRRGSIATTSQIPPQRFVDAITPLLESGEDILYVGMSSGISGAFQSAVIASAELKEQFPDRKIRLVDTLAASLGEGILVMRAVEMRAAGTALDDAADTLEEMKKTVCQLLLVEDLMYLRRTGRVSGVAAVIGSVMGVRPLLKGNQDGQLVVSAKIRGRSRAIKTMAERYKELVRQSEKCIVGIAHADCPEDAELLAGMIRDAAKPEKIVTVCYEPVTGAHTGPSALALFFTGDDDVRFR